MCQVIASRDGYPPRVKAPIFFFIQMCPTVKALERVGRRAKPTVGPRKFAARKDTCFINKIILGSETSNKFLFLKA